ncbi:MAG: carotenoid biosynthesis protein [Actinobacteria bacterium]|nr:carotenoid biosynthesis protein [Actinomycetota bacterium]
MNNLARTLRDTPLALLSITIALNISWPILQGDTRIVVTILGVISFFLESMTHAFVTRGIRYLLTFMAVVLPLAFAAEVIGVHTGLPFGDYSYSTQLGWMLWDVPLLIPLAWFMMMYPCWLIATAMHKKPVVQIGIFLDPQMVNEGFWVWHTDSGTTTQIPISNFFGWLLTAAIVFGILHPVLPKHTVTENNYPLAKFWQADSVPYLAVAWVWLGSFIANIGWFSPFLNQPRTAVTGLIGMGIVLVPFYLEQIKLHRAKRSS